MKSAWFHGWNLPDFLKFAWFHEICQISPWNSARFHHEICRISPWNLLDFMVYHWMLHCSIPCHEIWRISWYTSECYIVQFLAMKSAGFHLAMKSGRFHVFLVLFFFRTNTDIQYYMLNRQDSWSITECCIFYQNLAWSLLGFHGIHARFHAWNPLDFMVYHQKAVFIKTNTDI